MGMNPEDSVQIPRADGESQTLRALVEMRELLIRGEFKPGERIREIPLAARLGVSRTPLRLVLDRLEHEGLLKARPKGGFVARQFSLQDILDVIELRGTLEGMAARMAAERLGSKTEMTAMFECLAEIDRVLERRPVDVETVVAYIPWNERFHALMLDLAKSSMLRRSMEQVLVLPFASPNAFVASELNSDEWSEALRVSQWQHRAIADAIANRESGRAEAVAREHSRMARRSVMKALAEQRIQEMPGGPLVRLPEAG
jgi:GntR family transcriptional regulator, vanillate catabolism transcriptional regulator